MKPVCCAVLGAALFAAHVCAQPFSGARAIDDAINAAIEQGRLPGAVIRRLPAAARQLVADPFVQRLDAELAILRLVELQDVGNGREIQVVFFQVFLQVFHRFEICVEPFFLRIRHEHHAVRPFEDQLAAGFVEHLAGHGI